MITLNPTVVFATQQNNSTIVINGLPLPQTLAEHCFNIRIAIANTLIDNSLEANQIYIIAQRLGYGIHPVDENVLYESIISEEEIENSLNSVFHQQYTAASLPNQLITFINNTLRHSLGYSGRLETGYTLSQYAVFSGYLNQIFDEESGLDYFIYSDDTVIDINWNKVKYRLCQTLIKKNYFNMNEGDKSLALITQLLNSDNRQNLNPEFEILFTEHWIQSPEDLVNALGLLEDVLPDRMKLIQLAFQYNKSREERAEWLQKILTYLHPDKSITSPCADYYLKVYYQDLWREQWPQALFTEIAKKSIEEQYQILGYNQSALLYATRYLSSTDMSLFLDNLDELNEDAFLKDFSGLTKIFFENSENIVLLCLWLAQKNSHKTALNYLHEIISAEQLGSVIKENVDIAIVCMPVLPEETTKKIWFEALENITGIDVDSKIMSFLTIVDRLPPADKIKFLRMTDQGGNNTLLAVINLFNKINLAQELGCIPPTDRIDFSQINSIFYILKILTTFPYIDQIEILKQVGHNKANALSASGRTKHLSTAIVQFLSQVYITDQLDIWLGQDDNICFFYGSHYFKENPIRRIQSYDLDAKKKLLAELFNKIHFDDFIASEHIIDLIQLVNSQDIKPYFLSLLDTQENNLLEYSTKNPYRAAAILPLFSDDQVKKIILADNFFANLIATEEDAWWLIDAVISRTAIWDEHESKLYEILNQTDSRGQHPLLVAVEKARYPDEISTAYAQVLGPYLNLPLEPEQYVQLWLKENNKNNNALLTALWFKTWNNKEAAKRIIQAVECFVTQLDELSIDKQANYLLQLLPKIAEYTAKDTEEKGFDGQYEGIKPLLQFLNNCSPLLLTKLKSNQIITDKLFIDMANSSQFENWVNTFFHLLSDTQRNEILLNDSLNIPRNYGGIREQLINWVFKNKLYENFSQKRLKQLLENLSSLLEPGTVEFIVILDKKMSSNSANEAVQEKHPPVEQYSQFSIWNKTPPQKIALYEARIAQHLEKLQQKQALFEIRNDSNATDSPYQSLKRLNERLTDTFNQYKKSTKTLDDALTLESRMKAALDENGEFSKDLAVLAKHRGWKDFFIKFLLCVTILGGIYLAVSQRTKFTKTNTEQEMEKLGKTIVSSPLYG